MYNMAVKYFNEKNVVTPVGEALYCKVNTVYDDYKGNKKYVANVVFNEKDTKAMKAKFQKYLETAKGLPENEGKKWRNDEDRLGYREDEKTGKTLFTFKTKAFRDGEDGTEIQNYVPMFDEYGKPYGNDIALGNGSKIQVSFDPSYYYESKDGNGLSMMLKGILVHDLVEYGGGGSANALGFNVKQPDLSELVGEDPFDE